MPSVAGSKPEMEIVRTVNAMQLRALAERRSMHRIGCVPTMGCLHEGHLSLVQQARAVSDIVVLSIFVNPTQFGAGEDFARYPRDLDRDFRLCKEAGVDIVFCPEAGDMYAADASVHVGESELSAGLCGVSRPGHFRGVTTVVAKLFNIILPDVAVFGQKDAQQLEIIKRMVRDLNFAVSIIEAPTVREADGLAMSSRNRYLTPDQRRDALCLKRALDIADCMAHEGVDDVAKIRGAMIECLLAVSSAVVDYVEIVDGATLKPVQRIERAVLAAVAVKIGGTRLIDNCRIEPIHARLKSP